MNLIISFTGTTIKSEIDNLKAAMLHNFKRKQAIYDPDQSHKFCVMNGAPTIFKNILKLVSDVRYSKERGKHKYIVMNILYEICYGKSQKCNFLQKDHGLYLRMNHIRQEGLDTERRIGNTVCSRTVSNELNRFTNDNLGSLKAAVHEAIEKEWLIIVIIDDCTTIHAKRHSTEQSVANVNTMCTVVCRIFKDIPAIPLTLLW